MDELKDLIKHSSTFDPDHFEIQDFMLEKWQNIVDLLARIGKAKAALIMRIRGKDLEVFMASRAEGHPYHVGDSNPYIGSGLYCEHVIRQKEALFVPDAAKSEIWKNNPDMKCGMRCYLGFPIRFPDGRCFGTICILDDKENDFSQNVKDFMEKMRDLIESYLLLLQLSFTDQLTGLYNRTYFNLKMRRIAKNTGSPAKPLVAMLLDIDRFKSINDTLGHLTGDRVLRAFAKAAADSLRDADIAFRFGGDEFYLLLPDTRLSDARKIVEGLRRSIRTNAYLASLSVTTSIGIAERLPGEETRLWFKRMDAALYRDKRAKASDS